MDRGVKLPTVEMFGIMKVTDGPPLPKRLNVRWPEPMSTWMKEHWPGVPISRKWGEATVKRLPLGLGRGILKIIDSLGL